jgi:hypothetical protein
MLRQRTVSFELFDRQSRDAMAKADDSLVLQVGRKSWHCKEVDVSVMSAIDDFSKFWKSSIEIALPEQLQSTHEIPRCTCWIIDCRFECEAILVFPEFSAFTRPNSEQDEQEDDRYTNPQARERNPGLQGFEPASNQTLDVAPPEQRRDKKARQDEIQVAICDHEVEGKDLRDHHERSPCAQPPCDFVSAVHDPINDSPGQNQPDRY